MRNFAVQPRNNAIQFNALILAGRDGRFVKVLVAWETKQMSRGRALPLRLPLCSQLEKEILF
jgi:hypothetical protein